MSCLISVIIVDYNSGEMLCECLACLERQSYKGFEVVVVNNGDDNYTVLDLGVPSLDLTVKSSGKNLGFAVANNLAVKQAIGDWLAFLNPDAYPRSNWLEEFVEGLKCYPDLGLEQAIAVWWQASSKT